MKSGCWQQTCFSFLPLVFQSNSCCCREAAVFILMGMFLSGSGNNQTQTHADHLLQGGLHSPEIPGIALSVRDYLNFITTTSQKMMRIWKLFPSGKGWAMPSRWRDLLCCITKEQEYLKSFGEEKKLPCYLQQYNAFITAYSLISLTVNYCGCNKMTSRLLNEVLRIIWSLRARFTGAFQALRVPGSHCAFIFQDCLPERDLGQTAWASCLVSHNDSQETTFHEMPFNLPPLLQLA